MHIVGIIPFFQSHISDLKLYFGGGFWWDFATVQSSIHGITPQLIDPSRHGIEARRRGAVLRGAPAADARGGGLLHAEAGAPGERPGAGTEMMDIIFIDHQL
jgi:hypothetical protein